MFQVNDRPISYHPFSPWLAQPERLARTLVGREEMLENLLNCVINTEKGGSANHTLIVGPRGIGKTHLLCMVNHTVAGRLHSVLDKEYKFNNWHPVLFSEEEYARQNTLANFLLALFAKLREQCPLEQSWRLPRDLETQSDQEVCECCMEQLRDYHTQKQGRILILVDNVQKILHQWTSDEHDRLRAFLSGNDVLLIIGSAPSVFKEVISQKAAFHQFFDIRLVGDLNHEQVLELIGKWFKEESREQEFEDRHDELASKIPAIQTLTGGNPRLILFLCQIATRSSFFEIETALKQLLEELREYFVRRFDELPPQPRKVLDTLAEMSGPATPTEIAKTARLPLQSVNTQLARLKKNHYVRQIKLKRQRSTRYDIAERLFRLWRQTATVAGRQRFRFLTDFLKLYYAPDEVLALYKEHVTALDKQCDLGRSEIIRHIDELYYFQDAAEGSVRYEIFSTRIQSLMDLGEYDWAEQEAAYLAADSITCGDKSAMMHAYRAQAKIHLESMNYESVEQDIKGLLEADALKEAFIVAEQLVGSVPESWDAWQQLGSVALRLDNYVRALEAFQKSAEVGEPTVTLWIQQSVVLWLLDREQEALECAEAAVKMDDSFAWAWEQLGMVYKGLDDHKHALDAFKKAAEVGKPTAELWILQSAVLRCMDRDQEALECAKAAIEMDETSAGAWEQLGRAYGSLDNYEHALDAFQKAAEIGDPTAELWTLQSISLRLMGRSQEALECAEASVEMDEKSAWIWEQLGKACGSLGNDERALDAFKKAAEVRGPTAGLWILQSISLRFMGRSQEALECAEAAVEMDGKSAWALEQLGKACRSLGNDERALAAFEKASKVGEPTAELWALQSAALRNMGRNQEAIKCAKAAIEMDETSVGAWEQLGRACGNLGNYEHALDAFKKAAEIGDPTAELWTLQSISLRFMGRSQEALECAEAAVEMDEKSAWAWEQLGRACGSLGNHERAFGAFRKASEVGEPTADILALESLSLRLMGRSQEALACAEAAVKIDRKCALAWGQLGKVCRSLGNYERALAAFKRAVEVGGATTELLILQSMVLNQMGQFKDSAACSHEAMLLDPTSVQAVKQLVRSQQRLNQSQLALKTLDQFMAEHSDAGLLLRKAWVLSDLNRTDEALECVSEAMDEGVGKRDAFHAQGDIMTLGGQYEEALKCLDAGLTVDPEDWDLQADRAIALACLGKSGPRMEALGPALCDIAIPEQSSSSVSEYMLDIAHRALLRGENIVCEGLYMAVLSMQDWHAQDWFGQQLGAFSKRVLDAHPALMPDWISELLRAVKDEKTLRLLDPYIQAVNYAKTQDVTILEALFPEVRQLVLDIATRIKPDIQKITESLEEL